MPPTSFVVTWLLTYRYLIVYPFAIVEGPVLMMICGVLLRLGFFTFWPLYLLLIAGDLTGDIVWYLVGRHGASKLIRKYGKYISVTEQDVDKFEKLFHRHQIKILVISKLTTGFGFAIAVLIAAGAAKIPFKKYLAINFLGEFVWCGFLMGVGYFFGSFYLVIAKDLRALFIVGVVGILLFAAKGASTYFRRRLKNGTLGV